MEFQDEATPVAHAAAAGTLPVREAAATIRAIQERSLANRKAS